MTRLACREELFACGSRPQPLHPAIAVVCLAHDESGSLQLLGNFGYCRRTNLLYACKLAESHSAGMHDDRQGRGLRACQFRLGVLRTEPPNQPDAGEDQSVRDLLCN